MSASIQRGPFSSKKRPDEKISTSQNKQIKQSTLPEWDEKSSYPQDIYHQKVALQMQSQKDFLGLDSRKFLSEEFFSSSMDLPHLYILPKKEAYQLMKTARAADLGKGSLQKNQSDLTKPFLGLSTQELAFLQGLINKSPVARSRRLLNIVLVELLKELKSIDPLFKNHMRQKEKSKITYKGNKSDDDLNKEVDNYIAKTFWCFACAFPDYIEFKNSKDETQKGPIQKMLYMKSVLFFERIKELKKNIDDALQGSNQLNKRENTFKPLFGILMKLGLNQFENLFSTDLPLHAFSGAQEPEILAGNSSTKPVITSILSYIGVLNRYGKNSSPDYYGEFLEEFSLEKTITELSKRSVKSLKTKKLPKLFQDISYLICKLKKESGSEKYLNKVALEGKKTREILKLSSQRLGSTRRRKIIQQLQARNIPLQKKIARSTPHLLLSSLDDCMIVLKELLSQTPIHSIPLELSPSSSELKKRALYSLLHYMENTQNKKKILPNFHGKKSRDLQDIYGKFSIKIDGMIEELYKASIGQENSPQKQLYMFKALTHDVAHSYLPVLHSLAKGKDTLSNVLKELDLSVNQINREIAMCEIEQSDTELLEIELIKKFAPLFYLILLVQDSVEYTELSPSKTENPLFLPSACMKVFTDITPFIREKPKKERTFPNQTPKTQTKRTKELSLNPSDSAKKILAKLQEAGFFLKRVRGSHHQLEGKGLNLTVPVHGNERLSRGAFGAISKTVNKPNH